MIATITGENVTTAIGRFLAAVLPTPTEVILGQTNRVPEPASPNFVTMWPVARTQLATTVHRWDTVGNRDNIARPTSFDVQLDIHGPNSEDNAQVVSTLLRDAWGVSFFRPFNIEPLFTNDGQQMPFVNGEGQYEQRWTLTVTMQALPAVDVPQQYADSVIIVPVVAA